MIWRTLFRIVCGVSMRARRLPAALPLVAGLVLAAGCGSGPDPGAEPPVLHSPSVSTPAAPAASAAPSPSPSDDPALALEAAVAAMSDFVARDREYDVWWTAFREHLSPVAAQAFEYTDPRMIPATKLTDSGQLAASPDGTSATVLVGTDIGQYQVLLVRETVEHPWFVNRINPPEGSR